MSCPICEEIMKPAFFAKVLGKYQAEYECCKTCGYLRIREPHWLDEAYTSAIANADTGLVMRNITLSNKIARVLYWLMPERGIGHYLDFAGGYGMLTRMMRDFGFDFYWNDKYCKNLVAPGFEYSEKLGNCSAVTAIEVLEHVIDPKSFLKEVLDISGAKTVIFTTELYEGEPPKPDDWWYYSLATGQHIGFFKHSTLEKLAEDLGLKFYSANGLHIFTKTQVNGLILNLLTNRFISIFPPFLIRLVLGSKTLIDHETIINKIADTETKVD